MIDMSQAPTLKGSELGNRYTVKVHGNEVYLFENEERWFVEGRTLVNSSRVRGFWSVLCTEFHIQEGLR